MNERSRYGLVSHFQLSMNKTNVRPNLFLKVQFGQRIKTDAGNHLRLNRLHGGVDCVGAVPCAYNQAIRPLTSRRCN
jgi:hypothetical protein